MKKVELMQAYDEAKKQGAIDSITLFIHMPTGETETITNPNVEEKLKYVEKTYNDDLVHANCKDIYIEDVYFLTARDGFDFGTAINLLKQGEKMARKGWNGKGMYIFLCFPSSIEPKASNVDIFSAQQSIAIRTANSSIVVGWTASQEDLLAEDWVIVK